MNNGYKNHFNKVKKSAVQGSVAKKSTERSSSVIHDNLKGLKVSEAFQLQSKIEKKKSAQKAIRWKIPTFAFLGILILSLGLYDIENIVHYLEKIEISFLSSGHAETTHADTNKSSDIKPDNKNENSVKGSERDANAPIAEKNKVLELEENKVDHLQYINNRIVQLDEREKDLNKMESELEVQRKELDQKMKELQNLRESISSQLKDRVDVDSQKVDGLVQMYTNMRAPQAAKVFEAMDEDLVVEILSRMKRKPAAEVMNLLKPEKAKSISEKQAGYKRR